MQMNASASLLLCMAVLFGCASQEENQQSARELSRESEGEVREYLDKAKLEEVSFVRFRDSPEWEYLNGYFVMAEAYDGVHLIKMSRECADLRATSIYYDMADRRSQKELLRAGLDTIRACRIKTIYVLPEVDGLPKSSSDPNAPQ